MATVFLGAFTVDDEIILVAHAKLREVWSENILHHALECRRRITQSHGHDQELKGAKRCSNCSFVYVLWPVECLPEALEKVDTGDDLGTSELVKQVAVSWQGIAVLNSDGVKLAVVKHEA